MTKKLINFILIIIAVFIIIHFLYPLYNNGYLIETNQLKNKDGYSLYDDFSHCFYYIVNIVIFIFLCATVLFFLFSYFSGELDPVFAKYTDPKLQQFCNWVNRRNKTEC